MRQISEVTTYTKSEIEEMAKKFAKMSIVGTMFHGEFKDQTALWRDDGGIEVLTTYVRGDKS